MISRPGRRSVLSLALTPWLLASKRVPFGQTDLFRQGDAGVHTYRIPALIEARRGTLIAVADARHDGGGDLPARISLVMRRSQDRGRTWSAMRTLRAVDAGGVGDASLLLDHNTGRIWCFHAYGPPGIGFNTAKPGAISGPDTLQVHAIHSDDEGATWSAPLDLTPQLKDPAWAAIFATSGTHFQTSRGRYVVPLVVRDASRAVAARNACSDDAGKTWKVGPVICPESDESKALEIAGGVIIQNMRGNGQTRILARSSDGGVTFGKPERPVELVDPGCNAGFARYRHGGKDLLLSTNAAATKRRNLTLKLSTDGRAWSKGHVIHEGPAAYSTVLPLRDGSIAMLYECGETQSTERITFARFELNGTEERPR